MRRQFVSRGLVLAAPFAFSLLSLLSCDQGDIAVDTPDAPGVRVLGVNVAQDKPLPANADVVVRLDHLLLPLSVSRQSVNVVDGYSELITNPIVTYRPIARTVRIGNPFEDRRAWLSDGLYFKIVLAAPRGESTAGIRSISNMPLDTSVPRIFGFYASPPVMNEDPPPDFCTDVWPTFRDRCVGCHNSSEKNAGLSLVAGDLPNAFGRTARATLRGANTNGSPLSRSFLSDTPILDPGAPGTSYLLYLLLRNADERAGDAGAPEPASHCGEKKNVTSPLPLLADDRAALANSVGASSLHAGVTLRELARLEEWIERGARTRSCAPCDP